MTTQPAPDPLHRRVADVCYVAVVVAADILWSWVEDEWARLTVHLRKPRERHRVISVTRRRITDGPR